MTEETIVENVVETVENAICNCPDYTAILEEIKILLTALLESNTYIYIFVYVLFGIVGAVFVLMLLYRFIKLFF